MATKTATKEVTLETVLWNCRVALRGIGSTEKNRDAVIGLVFLKFAGDNDIAVIIDQAMVDIEKSNPPLKGALAQNLFATLGASKNAIKSLIDEVNNIDEKRFHEEDLIGRVYEYFLQIYAAAGTKEDGVFYTPASVVKLIAEVIEPYSGVVYDPCCGSGGMFVQSFQRRNKLLQVNVQ